MKKNTENNVPKKAFSMTCFDLQQIILIKHIYSKCFMNISRQHKEISSSDVFNSTLRWLFYSFFYSGLDLFLRSPTRFQSVKNGVFCSSKNNSTPPPPSMNLYYVIPQPLYTYFSLSLFFTTLVAPDKSILNSKLLVGFFGQAPKSQTV